jgi:Kyakuja-Dileera-Zisupton transposase
MDYIIFSSIQSCGLCRILLSYNIFCQWSKKQPQCHTKLPLALQLSPNVHLSGVVPKFHVPAHKQKCHTKFSLNLCPGAGHMDGEGIEHDWANLNPAASSMKEMSEGSHHDTINDLFRDWNYCKILGLGKYN